MLSPEQTRDLIGIVIPIYFQPEVDAGTIRSILDHTLTDQHLFCHPGRVQLVVDRGTTAARVLQEAPASSPLYGLDVIEIPENRGKARAIELGLETLLRKTAVPFLITRDCDGDHVVEDLPRLVNLALHIQKQTGSDHISVYGARASLEKPMGWIRDRWERLTNQVLIDAAEFLLARRGEVIHKSYWNQYDLDIQSGYRLYSRRAASITVDALSAVPNRRDVFTFACEIIPFLEAGLTQGHIGQVQRLTLVEQPVTSYGRISLSQVYGRLFEYICSRYEIRRETLLQIVDNYLVVDSLFFTDWRRDLLEFRACIQPDAPPPLLPPFI